MKYGRIIQKPRVKFFEVANGVFAGISPYRGISWANAGFINKGGGLVYDTFFDLFHAREMREAFMEVSNSGSPAYVVNSHYNSDHAWGNKVFEDACIIMHKEASRERLTENIAWMDSVIRRGKNSPESTSGERFFAAEFEGFDLEGVEWVLPNIEIKDDISKPTLTWCLYWMAWIFRWNIWMRFVKQALGQQFGSRMIRTIRI